MSKIIKRIKSEIHLPTMLIKTEGIVLRTVKYAETSLICDLYTEQLGLQTYIVSGVRKANARTGSSLLQVMSFVELVGYHQERKTMHRIREIKAAYVFSALPFSVPKASVGLFMAELLQKTVKEVESNPPLFHFIKSAFVSLDTTTASIANFSIVFALQLTAFLGFLPGGDYKDERSFFDLRAGNFTEKEPMHHDFLTVYFSKILFELNQLNFENAYKYNVSKEDRRFILDKIIQFYQLHIEGFKQLNSYEIFKEIF